MAKTIVLLLDGTSNQITRRRSHMLRLYGALEKCPEQMVYYDPGVGTFGADNAWSGAYRRVHELWGLATGWGLDANVKEAYRFLVENYREGDKIVLCGFSRGAYTARVLAGFCHAVGLIEPRNLNLVDYAFRAYKGVQEGQYDTGGRGASNPFYEVNMFDRMLRAPKPVIDVMLLFDTVASVIEWGRFLPRLRPYAFTSRNPSVRALRHAVAIDERRVMFQPTLWEPGPFAPDGQADGPQDVEEVWFSGVHSDVGGGVPEEDSALGKVPLRWMIAEGARLGVQFRPETVNTIVEGANPDKTYVKPDECAKPQDSMTASWFAFECLPRRKKRGRGANRPSLLGYYLPFGEPRHIPDGAKIHHSVFKRRGGNTDYDQPNIPEERLEV